jgi:hypothetical protein
MTTKEEIVSMKKDINSINEKMNSIDEKLDMLTERLLNPDDGVTARVKSNVGYIYYNFRCYTKNIYRLIII